MFLQRSGSGSFCSRLKGRAQTQAPGLERTSYVEPSGRSGTRQPRSFGALRRRCPRRPHGCFKRKILGQDRFGRRLHALGLARTVSNQQLRRVSEYRQIRTFFRSCRRRADGFLCAAGRSGKGEETIRAGKRNDRSLPALFRRVSVQERRIQIDPGSLLGDGTSKRRDLRKSLCEWLPRAGLDRRRDFTAL